VIDRTYRDKAINHQTESNSRSPLGTAWKHAALAGLSLSVLALMPPYASPPQIAARWCVQTLSPHVQSQLTVAETVKLYGKDARSRLTPHFKAAQIKYPPSKVTMLCLKEEGLLIVFAANEKGYLKQIIGYPIIGTSGVAGPKLREGDLQIPEGFYKVPALYPNSIAHLGIRLNYPNAQDRLRAKADKRTKLGGDILIHGSYWSTGCLAMGNVAIEELYVLVNDVGCKNVDLTFAPCDLRTKKPNVVFQDQPSWLPNLYKDLKAALKSYPIVINSAWKANMPKKPESED